MDRETKIEALVQAIPYVGGSLATLYYGEKKRKRFKRLEDFYRELGEDLEKVKSSIASIDQHSEEELGALIEEINERVENERIESKRKYYKNLYKKSLIHPVKGNFNERKYFVDLISQFTELHFQIITKVAPHQKKIPSEEISISGVDPSLIKGFIQQLINFGIFDSETRTVNVMHERGIVNHDLVELSELGKNFHYFCIER